MHVYAWGSVSDTCVSISIRVAGGDVKVGGGRYLRNALVKWHTVAVTTQRGIAAALWGKVQRGGSKPPCTDFMPP